MLRPGCRVNAVSVIERSLRGRSDWEVLRAATGEGRAVITQDLDFGQLAIAEGAPCFGIVLNPARGSAPEGSDRAPRRVSSVEG